MSSVIRNLEYLPPIRINLPLLALILIFTSFYYIYFINKNRFHLPPGPKGIPILGSLPFLGSKPYEKLNELSQKYGNVMRIYFGTTPVVVLGDMDSTKEAFNKDEFSGRPKGFFHLSNDYKSVVAMEGPTWKEHKRFNLKALKNLGIGENQVEVIIQNEITKFLNKLEKKVNQDINIEAELGIHVSNVMLSLTCGKTYEADDPMAVTLKDFNEIQYLMSATSYTQNLPWIAPFILMANPKFKRILLAMKKMEQSIKSEIVSHQEMFDENSMCDFMDHFLYEIKQRGDNPHSFDTGSLLGTSQAFLLAGSDTVRVTLEWAFLYMAQYPELQERAHQEIDHLLGSENLPSWKDKDQLPYALAVIIETSRIQTLTPLGILRCTLKNTTVQGYEIPKGTTVISNFWAIHMSPKYWIEPQKFNPERFLSSDGNLTSISPDYIVPFSFGKRNCPGERLSQVEMFLFFVSVLQRFKISKPKGGIRFDSLFRNTTFPLYPIVQFHKR